MSHEWLSLNFQQNLYNRNEMVRINYGKIKLDDLNLSLEAFKIKQKEFFLQ
jgi:hypothetical protein